MRWPKAKRTSFSICQFEHLVAVQIPPSGRLPWLCRHQQWHQDFLCAMTVHFLSHDCFDALLDPQAKVQVGVDARSRLAEQTRAKHQLATDRISVLGDFPQTRCENFAQVQGFLLVA